MTGSRWTVRPYRPGDETQIVRLFEDVFARPLTEERYRWKVLDAPWPLAAPSVWLALAGEQVVGHYAGTVMRFKLCGEEVTVLHVCDVMTARAFRRQGVLTTTGAAAHAAWDAAGVPFVTGLHYGGWGSRRHHLGWRELFKMAWLWRPLRPARLLRRRARPAAVALPLAAAAGWLWNRAWDARLDAAARDIEVVPCARPGPEFDALWSAVSPAYPAAVVRDGSWVSYRYAEAPGDGYRLLLARRGAAPSGYLAYRVAREQGRTTGWIADLFSAPDDFATCAALLQHALRALLLSGAEQVRALLPPGHQLTSSFRRAGFLSGRGAFDASIVPLAATSGLEELHDPRRWLTTGGDYDVV